LELAVNQNITGRVLGSLQQFIRNAEFLAKFTKRASAAETLRAEFQEEAVAGDRVDDSTGAGRGFDESGVDAGFAEGVGADEAGDAASDD
jgi:hypothetical protein